MTITLNGKEYDLSLIDGREFYSVEEEDGEKRIKIGGYLGRCTDNETWRHSYYCWAYIPITDEPIKDDDVTDVECECKMYEEEGLTEEQVAAMAMRYFVVNTAPCDENLPIIPMPIIDVTQDTPCGYYINMER